MKDFYLENAIMTASPAKLIEMMYERSIELLKEAKELIEKELFLEANDRIKRVQDILMELNASLDMEKGGQIAQSLRSLYLYMYKTLVEGNVKKDIKKIEEILGYFEELLMAWRTAMKSSSVERKPEGGFNISV
ncbi:flagellar export chaperone FliS [Pseudothermotoga sp.]|uniref:flagellar export chaperone FliS n=1 Tax=Pseudothermotoga sp. TaxID=2033661 RepID=UPI00299266CD|nr:flagellar export chaperone FliS [Pseudothermotoga sp.]MCX7812653.1 flagellar export chaperone FliS [Pseudothermotoga sp.]MDW8138933.1 flagellar export chaperone FliS [Pseudothermotoga sp.]